MRLYTHTHTHTLGSTKEGKNNSQSGITLVALVVTIVVLLILAGITIVYVFGDNGVFNKATQSKIQTELGKIEEQAGTIYADKFIEKQTGKIERISNRDIVDELIRKGNPIEIRTVGATSIEKISLEPSEISMDKSKTATIKVKIEGPEDGNLYYAVIDGKYYKMTFNNGQLTIGREAVNPEGTAETPATIEVEIGYDTEIVTNVAINQTEKTIEITSGEKYDSTTLTIKYGGKTANCKVTVKAVESNWAELAEIAKLIAQGKATDGIGTVTSTSNSAQATVTLNGVSKTIKVGQEFEVKYNGELRTVRVLGFLHDDLVNTGVYGGSHTKAGISFEFYDLMTGDERMAMNPRDESSGGWAASQMRKILNGYTTNDDAQSGAIGGLGANLSNKSYIKQVKKSYIKVYNDADSIYKDNDSTKGKNYTQDFLWFLSLSELRTEVDGEGWPYAYAVTTEGDPYRYYKDVDKSLYVESLGREKYKASGRSDYWWLRTPDCEDGYCFCSVNSFGNAARRSPASQLNGVSACFCV